MLAALLVVGAGTALAIATLGSTESQFARPTSVTTLHLDVAYSPSFEAMIDEAVLIVEAVPTGRPRFEPDNSGVSGVYYQDVRVLRTLKGPSRETVEVLTFSLSPEAERAGRIVIAEEDIPGRLPSGRLVLFLAPSAAPALQTVGFKQGTLPLSGQGRVAEVGHRGFPELVGLTVDELAARIAALG